ncbi:MAG: DegT/DnrJ/EryC1/StrS family aminotransferase [Hyphomicrobiaceae bacterium]
MDSTQPFIPFARPRIGEEEISAVIETLRSGWLTTGPKARQFEQDFAARVGAEHAVAVNSATAGLHLALEACGVGPGDRVITTPHTFTATAEVIRYLGADPVFVDIDREGLTISPAGIEAALRNTPRCKAIIPVHFGGLAAPMDTIMDIADRNDLKVVEDAAHALPTTCNGRLVGSIGTVTVFSFYANKTITTGEGGMAVTNSEALAKRMQTMRLHGISRDVFDRFTSKASSWYYEVIAPGYKYNLTDLAAAIGIIQLRKADEFATERAAIAARYNVAFADMPVVLPQGPAAGDTHSWHLYVLQLKLDELRIDRDRVIDELRALGIGTSVHYIPLHRQPYWRDTYHLSAADFPVSDDVYHRSFSLPIWQGMSDAEIDRVIVSVRNVLTSNRS